MKAILFALILFTSSAFAAKEYAQINVDWNARHLSETVVLMCDDTYYSGVDVTVPGEFKYGIETSIRYTDCDATVKISKKQTIIENGVKKTKFRVTTDTSCTFEIREDKRDAKTFELYIADAC